MRFAAWSGSAPCTSTGTASAVKKAPAWPTIASARLRTLRHSANQPALRQVKFLHCPRCRRPGRKREPDLRERDDFWATTSNEQLNFLQHVKSLLKIAGTAAVVVPDNVLLEGVAGETVRRRLLHEYDVHTLLRLPTGIFYAQSVKANVLFFEHKSASETPWTHKLWVYDLRPNQQFTFKQNSLSTQALRDFTARYNTDNWQEREET